MDEIELKKRLKCNLNASRLDCSFKIWQVDWINRQTVLLMQII